MNEATSPGLVTATGTVHVYEYVPGAAGVAVIVAGVPAQMVGELTETTGSSLIVTVPLPGSETQPVIVFVIITLYDPATVVVKETTSPGLVTAAGTVHAYEYVPAVKGVAVIVAAVPAQMAGELTVTTGSSSMVTVPMDGADTHVVAVLVMITLYDPATVVVNEATSPGLATAEGTVHVYE